MIVYSGTRDKFLQDVTYNQIAMEIKMALESHGISGGGPAEFSSWTNSMNFMKNILEQKDIPNVNVAIEYEIPKTSKRVDFMISGANEQNKENIVIVELKQWSEAEKVDDIMVHSVRTFTGGGKRLVNHPSYQAYAYAAHIKDACAFVQDHNISVVPCAYLHNYQRQYISVLEDPIYKDWYDEAPFFISDQARAFHDFIKKYISKVSGDGKVLYEIDNGRIRPSKALQDCIVSVLKGNPEFVLLDDQATAYDVCVKTALQCQKDRKKRTIIIQGGPGTGKSVLAINLLKELTTKDMNVSYCTKNNAPRNAFVRLLTKSDLKKEIDIKSLFRSPFRLCEAPSNYYDCLIVDEAHRLVKAMNYDIKGVNEVKECIDASLLSIFLIDENQRVTTHDIGTIDEINKWAFDLNSEVIANDDLILKSQFRCNGSDLYIQLINNILQIGEHVDLTGAGESERFEIKVFDTVNEMKEALRQHDENNKARMVAGYCFDWNVKYKRADYDIILDNGDFKAKWNLESDKTWAVNPKSFDEVGCVHTAQGLEFDYVGVIIGKDLRFDPSSSTVVCDQKAISKDDRSSGIRSAPAIIAKRLLKNTYKTLLTRGQKGCYIFCEDKSLKTYIERQIELFFNQN